MNNINKKNFLIILIVISILIFVYAFLYYLKLKKQDIALNVDIYNMNQNISLLSNNIDDLNKKIEEQKIQNQNKNKSVNELNKKIDDINKKIIDKQNQTKNRSSQKIAYLTFDDGPSINTSKILDILDMYNIKATFFVNGRTDANSVKMYKRIVNENDAIGNHTYSHDYKSIYNSTQNFNNDFNKLQQLILNTTGVNMNIMRFPGGSNNSVSNKYSNNRNIMEDLTSYYRTNNFVYFDWNVCANDSVYGHSATTNSVISDVLNGAQNKKYIIILMHDPKNTTIAALPIVIQTLLKRGYKFCILDKNAYIIQFK